MKDIELEQEPHHEDVDLMLRAPQVIPQFPPPPATEPTLREKGYFFLLDDDLIMDVYNLSFHELQNRIVQAWRNQFLDDHASLAFIKERVIVSDTRKHPNAIVKAILAYEGETRSNVQYLMAKNEQLAHNL